MSILEIDGSMGEGGGQVLRSSLALGLITGRPFAIHSIRAGRKKPGLLRQHRVAVQAAEAIGAHIEGAELGASALRFEPGEIRGGDIHLRIGSAGSVHLVLQTVLPALVAAGVGARIRIEGGTHNPDAPPFEYVAHAWAPVLARMGVALHIEIERRGFFPAGGGCITAELAPRSAALEPVELVERGALQARRARAIVSQIPEQVAERELAAALHRLGWPPEAGEIVHDETSPGPGNALLLEAGDGACREIAVGFGRHGRKAERVAIDAARQLERWIAAEVPVGRRLADQLMLPFAICGGGAFRTMALSRHSETNLAVLEAFAPGAACAREDGDATVVAFADNRCAERARLV